MTQSEKDRLIGLIGRHAMSIASDCQTYGDIGGDVDVDSLQHDLNQIQKALDSLHEGRQP